MIGFYAEYESGEIKLQRSELGAGGWFTMDNLPPIPENCLLQENLLIIGLKIMIKFNADKIIFNLYPDI